MEHISVLNSIIETLNNIVNLVKYLFDLNWLFGIIAGFIIFILCIAFMFYAIIALILYFSYIAFQNGQYLQGISGILFLIFCYWYGKKNEEKNKLNKDDEKPTTTSSEKSSETNKKESHENTGQSSHDKINKEDIDIISWSYRVLGCQPDDPFNKIKQAYRELAKQYHPDGFHSKPQEFIDIANKKMNEINSAYKTICNVRGEQ